MRSKKALYRVLLVLKLLKLFLSHHACIKINIISITKKYIPIYKRRNILKNS